MDLRYNSFVGVLLLVALTSVAREATANSILNALSQSGLIQQDIDIMMREGGKLYAHGKAVTGSDAIWSNPATGAFGMVEVIEVDGQCVRLTYKFRSKNRQQTQRVISRRCRSQDGRWILAP